MITPINKIFLHKKKAQPFDRTFSIVKKHGVLFYNYSTLLPFSTASARVIPVKS